jgi:Transposase domain (DUF772)
MAKGYDQAPGSQRIGRGSVLIVDLADRVDPVVRAGNWQRAEWSGMSPACHASDGQMDAAIWCRHLVPDRSRYGFLADHRHQLFPPETFADLTRQGRGHPSVPAEVITSVLVLQALEGLSDREAASALRRDIAWKIACGLRLDDEGFHPTVLVYWRDRIRASQRPKRIFDAVRQVVEATGVLAGQRWRTIRLPTEHHGGQVDDALVGVGHSCSLH